MTKLFSSIRWKVLLAFFLIIGLSFLVMASTLTNLLGRYLFEQRIRADRASLERWAVQAAPFLSGGDMTALSEDLSRAGSELSGRLLLLDAVSQRDYPVITGVFLIVVGMALMLFEAIGESIDARRSR